MQYEVRVTLEVYVDLAGQPNLVAGETMPVTVAADNQAEAMKKAAAGVEKLVTERLGS